jgi:uncharacterized membrane protein (TIGR02234 family)
MLLAGGQVWFKGTAAVEGLPALPLRLTGRDVAAVVSAVGLLALAGAALVLFVGRVLRRIVGGVLLLGGLAAVVRVVQVLNFDQARIVRDALVEAGTAPAGQSAASVDQAAWPWVALLGSLLVALGAAAVLLRAGRWTERSKRYETKPAAPDPAEPDAMWKALDRGEDPTDTGSSAPPA